MQFSALGTITGILVNAGLGQASDFATADCSGGNKIALIQRGLITFRSKVLNAIADGCIGAVIFNNRAGNFFGTLISPAGITIPAVSLSQAERPRAKNRSSRTKHSHSRLGRHHRRLRYFQRHLCFCTTRFRRRGSSPQRKSVTYQ